ncbi:hypothetical protein AF457_05900 [Listeria monocytogenes]|nr:hypothetical protein [Listeria monocytogenes]EAC3953019.1 hypothetical protein [Listeria monocytogenes]EAC9555228.1 hypothetical protein [Listeria monocytogenes]EAD0532568.1 hypothetical protein [Listeria monocytogenes]EAE1964024.1 hypothetical protein [Listeria monocytogenes]
MLWNESLIYAAEMNSETSIQFDDTYVYKPEPKLNDTPTTGNPKSTHEYLPRLSDSKTNWPQILGLDCLIFGFVLKKLKEGNEDEKN